MDKINMEVRKPSQKEIDETNKWGTWSKEISEFKWEYDEKETCYILEGQAEVSDNAGNKISFKPGDLVTFQQGLKCTWKVLSPIKKKYIFG